MKISRVIAVAKKEFIQIRRDPLSLAMAFMMPVMLLLIFGYAITLDVDNLRTVVHDLDKSSLSREYVSGLGESGYFTVVRDVNEYKAIDGYLDTGRAQAAIAIPRDFSENIKTGRSAELQVIVDGSDSNTATIALGYISAATELFSRKAGGLKAPPAIDPRVRVWYNPELKSRNYIIPGLIAVIMSVIAALLTSLTIAREWERGTMEQLISTPIKKAELLLGKLVPYFLIGFVDMVLSVLMGTLLFEVPLKGSVFLLMALSSVFLFGGLSLGILISTAAGSQLVASQVAMIATFLPAFLLSGFMYAIANMPDALQAFTYVIPARYFVTMLKGMFLKGSTLRFLWLETALLVAYGIAVFTITHRKLKKKVA
ncbi:MAG: ABC transporter permease [Nitrospirota bacterium]|jgi:ABC-2 type transport system permease protein